MTRNWKTGLTLAFTGKIYFRILGLGLGLACLWPWPWLYGIDTSGLVSIPAPSECQQTAVFEIIFTSPLQIHRQVLYFRPSVKFLYFNLSDSLTWLMDVHCLLVMKVHHLWNNEWRGLLWVTQLWWMLRDHFLTRDGETRFDKVLIRFVSVMSPSSL